HREVHTLSRRAPSATRAPLHARPMQLTSIHGAPQLQGGALPLRFSAAAAGGMLAEGEGFEPSRQETRLAVFETASFGHSDTPPRPKPPALHRRALKKSRSSPPHSSAI